MDSSFQGVRVIFDCSGNYSLDSPSIYYSYDSVDRAMQDQTHEIDGCRINMVKGNVAGDQTYDDRKLNLAPANAPDEKNVATSKSPCCRN